MEDKEIIGEADKLTQQNQKKIEKKAGLTSEDLWYQFFSKTRLSHNFNRVTVMSAIVLLLVLIVVLIVFYI